MGLKAFADAHAIQQPSGQFVARSAACNICRICPPNIIAVCAVKCANGIKNISTERKEIYYGNCKGSMQN
ncbi:hypothetical protein BRYFOR_09096 [Marvinbryantia formatexigens DSM 14469]|uniref:Uncharacterized protein n=1 Tax=Marvinbryantia formatexigens DSM 14469 TaxID=478749 RepID=C6LKA9_9FIRM|nr:hypothetical protein BRYFOR_09096 [Marvinbryantia formatexigens DSM 14469]